MTLIAQAAPVVEALHVWSGFAPRGTWGMLTSSWAAHLVTLSAAGPDQSGVLPELQQFFAGDDLVALMQTAGAYGELPRRDPCLSAARQLLPILSVARGRAVRKLPAGVAGGSARAQPRLDAAADRWRR